MKIPGLDNLEAVAWRECSAGEFVIFAGNRIIKGPIMIPGLVVTPAEGFTFQYDIEKDEIRVSASGSIIPIPAIAPEKLENTTFQLAFSAIEKDHSLKIARAVWNEQWLEWDIANHPMLTEVTKTGTRAAWQHRKDDLMARDWMVVSK